MTNWDARVVAVVVVGNGRSAAVIEEGYYTAAADGGIVDEDVAADKSRAEAEQRNANPGTWRSRMGMGWEVDLVKKSDRSSLHKSDCPSTCDGHGHGPSCACSHSLVQKHMSNRMGSIAASRPRDPFAMHERRETNNPYDPAESGHLVHPESCVEYAHVDSGLGHEIDCCCCYRAGGSSGDPENQPWEHYNVMMSQMVRMPSLPQPRMRMRSGVWIVSMRHQTRRRRRLARAVLGEGMSKAC